MMKTTLALSVLSMAGMAAAAQHFVSVSAYQYEPASLTADEGDTVTFVFSGTPGLHSVTQSNFANPCAPLENGFSSGFISVAAGFKGPFEEYTLTITNKSQPIWYYCAQTNPQPHCSSFGMVGAINAPTSGANTFEAFQAAAKALPSFPSQSISLAPTGGVGVSVAAAAATGTDAAATTATPTSSGATSGSSTGTSTGTGTSSASTTTKTGGSSAATLNSGMSGLAIGLAAAIFGVAL